MKKESKIARAAHIKSRTHGTSNEISFSVLDAAKQSLDGGKKAPSGKMPSLGFIPVFTFGRRKKPPATPVKEQGIMLPSGEFISTEGGSSGQVLPVTSSITSANTGSPASSSATAGASASGESPTESIASLMDTLASPSLKQPALPSASSAPAATPSSSKGGAWVAPKDEVAKRKATRKRRKAFVAAVLVLTALGALAAIGITIQQSMQAKQDIRTQLLGQIDLIEEADAAVLELDELVVSCINDGWDALPADTGSNPQALKADLEESGAVLLMAKEGITAIQPKLEDPYDQEAATQALVAIETRLGMIESGRSMLDQAVFASNALHHADEAWVHLVEGDSLAREAAQLASATSKETVPQSMAKSREALVAFAKVDACLDAAEAALEGLDCSVYREYVDLREEAIGHALLSDQAYLDRNKEKAAEENELYNQLDAEAAALGKEIGAEPSEMVKDLVGPAIEAEISRYTDERAHASIADSTLRTYLAS